MYAKTFHARSERRGVVLLIVLAMLGLFAAVGISFAVLARSESRAALNFKRSLATAPTSSAGPEASTILTYGVNQLIFDTRNVYSAIRGHSLLRDMYGSPDTLNTGSNTPNYVGAEVRPWPFLQNIFTSPPPYQGAFNGTGIFLPRNYDGSGTLGGTSASPSLIAGVNEWVYQIMSLTPPKEFGPRSPLNAPGVVYYPFLPYNFTRFDAVGNRPGTPYAGVGSPAAGKITSTYGNVYPEPEQYFVWDGANVTSHWFGYDEDYDAADHNNMFLALERADGTMINPSFHRPYLVYQLEAQGLFKNAYSQVVANEKETLPTPALSPRRIIFRPRVVDYGAQTVLGTGLPENFPMIVDKNGNGIVGDIPAELDVDTDGDGKPDAVWVDLGYPPFVGPDGTTLVKPLFAFKVLGLDGRVNLNIAGNLLAQPTGTVTLANARTTITFPGRPEGHVSSYGASQTEINPKHLTLMDDRQSGTSPANKTDFVPLWNAKKYTDAADSPYGEDPKYLRNLLTGVPPSNAALATPIASGRWNATNLATASIADDRAGFNGPSDDTSNYLRDYNSSSPPSAAQISPAVSSSLGPVNMHGFGQVYQPFSSRTRVMNQYKTNPGGTPAGYSNRGEIFPTFVNHIHGYIDRSAAAPYKLPTYWAPGPLTNDPNFAATQTPPLFFFDLAGQFTTGVPGYFNPMTTTNGAAPPVMPAIVAPPGPAPVLNQPPKFVGPYANSYWLPSPRGVYVSDADFENAWAAMAYYMTTDVATDYNPYVPSIYNSGFTAAQFERLARDSDLDAYQLDDRLLKILSVPAGNESQQNVPYQYPILQTARDRVRRMVTHSSWDSNHFSDSPTFGDDLYPTPNTVAGTQTTAKNPQLRNDASVYDASTQHNGKIPWYANATSGSPAAAQPLGAYSGPNAGLLTTAPAVVPNELVGRLPPELMLGKRYDLNKPLTTYEVDPNRADAERSAMAQQIYVLLYYSAGLNTRRTPANLAEAKEAFAQARTLAQLAVNIVDYLDPDSVMTRMVFYPNLDVSDPNVGATWTTWETATTAQTISYPVDPNFPLNPVISLSVLPEEFTVLGFEMPEMVINEGVSITVPGVIGSIVETFETTFVFAEIFNPWPSETDWDAGVDGASPVKPLPRGRLYDQPNLPFRTAVQSRFLLGARQASNPLQKGPSAVVAPSATDQYIDFSGTSVDGSFTAPRNLPLAPDVRGGQRLLVEPGTYPGAMTAMDPGPDPPLLVDASGNPWNSAQGPNRYTAAAPLSPLASNDLRIVRKLQTAPDNTNMNMVVSLYRLRNPYVTKDPVTNPYVAIDTLELKYDAGNPTAANGVYRLTAAGVPAPKNRNSMERKQPWQGSQRPWLPYKGIAAITTLYDSAAAPPRFLEGKFLGFPYLTADGSGASTATYPFYAAWGNQLYKDGFAASTDTTKGHTLFDVQKGTFTSADYTANRDATVNTVDNAKLGSRYISFPYLNRALATPLELLSTRLYGSHIWAVQNASPVGAPADAKEWRLRFTDDFEFATDPAGFSGQAGGTPNYPALPGTAGDPFNRIYRSRETPWYLNDRGNHPIDARAAPGYDPNTANNNSLSPFPNLYRFFEFVECRSRMAGAGSGLTRQDRVAGKINMNLIADEEVFKALFDTEEAMPWTPAADYLNYDVLTLKNSEDYLRPGNFPLEVSDNDRTANNNGSSMKPLSPTRAIGFNPLKGIAELTLAGADLKLQALTTSPPPTSNNRQSIDYGGANTVDVSPVDMTTTTAHANVMRLLNNQFPGVVNGFAGYDGTTTLTNSTYPGWDYQNQVSSELYRAFLLSRNGADALFGTVDDKPFRGFGSAFLADTFLRRRNFSALDYPREGATASTASAPIAGSASYNGNVSYAPGEYVTKLGGQWTPRLFDPIPMPFQLDPNGGNTPATLPLTPANTMTIARRADVAADPNSTGTALSEPAAVEYWMLEYRRNRLLAKIANNTTTRSHVFGAWVTVGYFRVEPGTQNLQVPLLNEEFGSLDGTNRRHRGFFIIDRSKATQFTTSDLGSNPKLDDNPLIEHYSITE